MMFAAIPVVDPAALRCWCCSPPSSGSITAPTWRLFPSFTKDYWGIKNYGLNYGALFSAWGIGGFVMGKVSEMLNAQPGGLSKSFMLSGCLLAFGAAMTIFLAELKPATEGEQTPSQWQEFWAEFKLGARVFAGYEQMPIRVKPEFRPT